MTDYSPFAGSSSRQLPRLELVRTLWTMTKSSAKPITAAIYKTETGLELRIHVGGDTDNLIDSLLSRGGELPLTFRADERMALLLERGWMDGRSSGGLTR